jgi:hypothetical protein
MFLKYCLIVFFVNTKTTWAQHRVVIDTIADMERYGDQGVCTPYESYYDITCKDYPPNVSNRGFWSSCSQGNCELKINIGSLGGLPAKPVKLEVLSFVQGSNSEIRARHQLVPGGTIANINPLIESAPGWVNNELNLNPNLAWTEDSVILIRLSSSPFNDEIDIVDKIVVEFLGDSPSTIEPSTIEPDVSTIEPEPSTIEPSTLEPSTIEPSTIEPEPSTVEPEPSTIEPEPSTIEPESSTIETVEPSTIEPIESSHPGEQETTEIPAPYCDEDHYQDSGYFQSPYYPKNYPSGADCTIRFAAPSDKVIQISFVGPLDIESDKNCSYDYFEFRDGPFPQSTYISRIIRHKQNPQTVTSTSNYLYARFHSDDSQNYQGFTANYTHVDRDCNCNCNI